MQFDYEVWEIIIYFTTCFSFWRLFYTDFLTITGIRQTGRNFFSAEDYTNMSYYNCCGIRPKHNNFSKRVGEGVTTICVVFNIRSKHSNISKRGWVLQFVWYWDQNSGNVQGFQSGPVPGTFTRLRLCIVPAEITEPPPKICGGQNHKYDRLVEYFS